MNIKLLFILTLGWLMAGCVSSLPINGDMFGASGTVSVAGCTAPAAPVTCTGTGDKPVIEIDLNTFTVSPECVKAKKGKSVKFKLKKNGDIRKSNIVVFPKDALNYFWLARENSGLFSKKKIKTLVPKKFKTGDIFPDGVVSYGVLKVDTGECIDPRIHVVN